MLEPMWDLDSLRFLANGQVVQFGIDIPSSQETISLEGVYAPNNLTDCSVDERPFLLDPLIRGTDEKKTDYSQFVPYVVKIFDWPIAVYGEHEHQYSLGTCIPTDTELGMAMSIDTYRINLDMCPGGLANDRCQKEQKVQKKLHRHL